MAKCEALTGSVVKGLNKTYKINLFKPASHKCIDVPREAGTTDQTANNANYTVCPSVRLSMYELAMAQSCRQRTRTHTSAYTGLPVSDGNIDFNRFTRPSIFESIRLATWTGNFSIWLSVSLKKLLYAGPS